MYHNDSPSFMTIPFSIASKEHDQYVHILSAAISKCISRHLNALIFAIFSQLSSIRS